MTRTSSLFGGPAIFLVLAGFAIFVNIPVELPEPVTVQKPAIYCVSRELSGSGLTIGGPAVWLELRPLANGAHFRLGDNAMEFLVS